MRWILVLVLCGCVGGYNSDRASTQSGDGVPAGLDGGAMTALPDAGTAAITDGGAATAPTLCSGAAPDSGITDSPGPVPASDQQAANWSTTGAAGCDGLVPHAVPPRLSWTAPVTYCFEGEPLVDGSGNLVFAYDTDRINYNLAFFPADGRAGRTLTTTPGLGAGRFFHLVAPRPSGFYGATRLYVTGVGAEEWIRATAGDGSQEALLGCEMNNVPALSPDPRGGYAQSRVRVEATTSGTTWNLEVRWVRSDLAPRTQWWPITSWNYSYNVFPEVQVDVNGNALVLLYFDPPMSMPCNGNMTRAAWVSDSGAVAVFTPVSPSAPNTCGGNNSAGFGLPVALAGGGFAFYVAPRANVAPSGWYAYAAGSGDPVAVPDWLKQRGPVQRLASGAYLAIRRDPTTCARTAEIVGPRGQICASVAIAGSDGCDDEDRLSADGTLALHQWDSCSIRWWPLLGGGR